MGSVTYAAGADAEDDGRERQLAVRQDGDNPAHPA